jgi:hypothetical protein
MNRWLTPIDRPVAPLALPPNSTLYDAYDRSVFALDRPIGQLNTTSPRLTSSQSQADMIYRVDSLAALSSTASAATDYRSSAPATPLGRTPPSGSPMDSLSTSPVQTHSFLKDDIDKFHRRAIGPSGSTDFTTPPRDASSAASSTSLTPSVVRRQPVTSAAAHNLKARYESGSSTSASRGSGMGVGMLGSSSGSNNASMNDLSRAASTSIGRSGSTINTSSLIDTGSSPSMARTSRAGNQSSLLC